MPELPEVECLRRSLEPRLVGARVARATLLRDDFLSIQTERRGPTAARRALLEGARIVQLRRHGKQLAIIGQRELRPPRVLVVHLGMTGQVLVTGSETGGAAPTHVHARWELRADAMGNKATARNGGATVLFRDARRFGGLWALDSAAALDARWGKLGPDALTVEPGDLFRRLQKTNRPIKAALLDQSVVAGVGNIYADESLFQAGINPMVPAGELSLHRTTALAAAIRDVLAGSILAGGTTLRDYRDADGVPGAYQTKRMAYGRGGEGCVRCGGDLASATLAHRTTTWCPRCQSL